MQTALEDEHGRKETGVVIVATVKGNNLNEMFFTLALNKGQVDKR